MQISDVTTHDCKELTAIAMKSKAHWGYDENFMHAAREELAVTVSKVNSDEMFYRCAKDQNNNIVGFFCVNLVTDSEFNSDFELDALFTHPNWIGKGVGRQLFVDACNLCVNKHAKALIIQSDPNAVGFYHQMGCEIIGERASGSIVGRTLPVMRKILTE